MFRPGTSNVNMSQPAGMPQPQPQSSVMPSSMPDQNYVGLNLQRFDNMDKNLGELDSIVIHKYNGQSE